jgi:predicted  nucleic acid-binding Zn-ribbon protein
VGAGAEEAGQGRLTVSGDIDRISEAIGELRAGQTSREETMRRVEGKLDDLADEIRRDRHDERNRAQVMQGRIDRLEPKVADHQEAVDDYRRMKQRGLGIVAGVGVASSAGGAAVWPWLKGLIGWKAGQ